MSTQSNHYIGKIKERNGEYEYISVILFKTAGSPSEHLTTIASTMYDGEVDNQDGNYFYNCGEVCVSAVSWHQIDESVYKTLLPII